MPRRPRVHLPGLPIHLVQRGHNREACFFTEEDFLAYREWLAEALRKSGCTLHAYVLMTNHVHLLLTPAEVGAISRLMQTFGRKYAGLFNGRHGRTGTLLEGRYKSCLVDSERYVLTCYRYIGLNPMRAWMTDGPKTYAWSSCRANATGYPDPLITPHPNYCALGRSEADRQASYCDLLAEVLPEETLAEIRIYLQQ